MWFSYELSEMIFLVSKISILRKRFRCAFYGNNLRTTFIDKDLVLTFPKRRNTFSNSPDCRGNPFVAIFFATKDCNGKRELRWLIIPKVSLQKLLKIIESLNY